MYELKILVFGGLKAYFPPEQRLEVDEKMTIAEIIAQLPDQSPEAAKLIDKCALAVDGRLVQKDSCIGKAAELAILPPFSGG